MSQISKFHIGSKIINADTQTDVGTILHDGSLKTVNGVSLVGSGDFSPLSLTLIGSTSSTATFTHDISQYKFIFFEYEVDIGANVRQTHVERYSPSSNTYYHDDIFNVQSGDLVFTSYIMQSGSIQITNNSENIDITIYGVK